MCAPNAAVTLNLVKERVNRARGHRIAADEQRMKAQRLAKLLMLYEAGNDGINRTPRLIAGQAGACRSEEHTSELQSLMRISYAVFCLKKKILTNTTPKS